MGFKHFRRQCIIRVLLLGITLGAVAYLWVETQMYATLILVGIFAVYQAFALTHYVETTNRQLTRFMQSIEYADLSQTFSGSQMGSSFDELYRTFTEVTNAFRTVRAEREEQYRYLQTVVQHVGVGVIAYRSDGDVEIMNTAARRLLGLDAAIHNLAALEHQHRELVSCLREMVPSERRLQKVGESQLSLHTTEFKMQDRELKLVSIQNIESELEEKEMEAWQNLIRVLTHEIMNSVTPIASLASTANGLLAPVHPASNQTDTTSGSIRPSERSNDSEDMADVRVALKTIQSRSEGLLHFVQAYRNLTRIRTPELQTVRVSDLFDQLGALLNSRMGEGGINRETSIEPASLTIEVDPELVEQVLINLMTNAIQAVAGRPDATIRLTATQNANISVVDNGPGILKDVLDKIFIPFFTTKQKGSGIGLSLSRQIMRLHRGVITARSEPEVLTSFTLRFPPATIMNVPIAPVRSERSPHA